MKMAAVGVGRPGWGPAPHDWSSHHQTALYTGKGRAVCASKVQQQASTSGSEMTAPPLSSRLAPAQMAGAAGLVGFWGAPQAERPGRLGRRRFGKPGGDCCRASVRKAVGSRFKQEKRVVRARAGAGARGGSDESRSDGGGGGGGDEAGSSSVWDLPARHRRIQEAAAKVGDPFRDMMTNASKKLQDYLDNIKLARSKDSRGVQKSESEWDKWQKVFAEVDERERLVSILKFQLEEAVDREDFQEAATLKQTIASASANDTVSEVMTGLKSALEEERYSDAARLRDKAGAGLVGWWVGLAEGGNDPYGRIIHIAASQGRFIAKTYSARQLATAASGMPLFEVFVQNEGGDNFSKQAVYLQRDGNVAADAATGHGIKDVDVSGQRSKDGSKDDSKSKDMPTSPEKSENSPKNAEDFIDEGINNIISFLKDRMPDVRLKVLQVIAPDGLESDIPKLVEQLMDAEEKEETSNESETEVSGNGEASVVEQPEQNKIPVGGSTGSSSGEQREKPVRLVIGGVLQTSDNDKVPRPPLRVPANIEHKSKDEFVFHIEDSGTVLSPASTSSPTKEALPSWKVATIATQASTDLVPDDVAKVLWNVEKVPVKVSKEMGEIIRLAVSQAQRRRGLSKSTAFRRVILSNSATDPLSGLYIGAFGPYTSEVVQLRRKYGQWQEDDAGTNPEKLEFFEYVEAIKLTGDLNVPAGQVTFRAKIGRENRLSLRGAYPEELGVAGRYKGQGRLAEPGFRNPQWIDGEMVLLDGKQGGGHTNGAELGFVYSVPERHFLVLFNRLKLRD